MLEQSLRERNKAMVGLFEVCAHVLDLKGAAYIHRGPEKKDIIPLDVEERNAWEPIILKAQAKGFQVSDWLFKRACHNINQLAYQARTANGGPPIKVEDLADAMCCTGLGGLWILNTGEIPLGACGYAVNPSAAVQPSD